MEYQNAVIGTIQTTLNAGTIFVTLFPNFNMSLKDPHLCDALKVQVQISSSSFFGGLGDGEGQQSNESTITMFQFLSQQEEQLSSVGLI